jgi:hypothetical protein
MDVGLISVLPVQDRKCRLITINFWYQLHQFRSKFQIMRHFQLVMTLILQKTSGQSTAYRWHLFLFVLLSAPFP